MMTPEQAIRLGQREEDARISERLFKQRQTLLATLRHANEELIEALDKEGRLQDEFLAIDNQIKELIRRRDVLAAKYDAAHTEVGKIRKQVAEYNQDLRLIEKRIVVQPAHKEDPRIAAYRDKQNGTFHTST